MRKADKILGAQGLAASIALTIALAAAPVQSADEETFWSAKGDQGWVTGYGECWESKGGPTNIPPCSKAIIESFTIDLVNDEFEFDKYFLKPDMKVALDQLARDVKGSPGVEALTIVGHTDGIGTQEYNLGLGMRRAQATKEYLVNVGGLDPSLITVESRGKLDPVATNDTAEGRARNRRIEVVAAQAGS